MSDLAKRIANLSPAQLAQLTQQLQQRQAQSSQDKSRPDLLRPDGSAPILPQPRQTNAFPLSFAQQRFWFLYQLQPDSAAYNVPAALELSGPLRVDLLEQSLTTLIQRHDVLRTRLAITETGEPHQVILPAQRWDLSVVDLQDMPPAQQTQAVNQWAIADAKKPFNLLQDLPLRTTLLKLSSMRHVLLICFHHIAIDGWSLGLFVEELTALYDALHTDKVPALPALPIQYVDFTLWQRQLWQDGQFDAQLAYWQAQLAGNLPVLQLPFDFPNATAQSFEGRSQSWEIPGVLPALKRLSQTSAATLFMTLLAAFQVLLHRYSGQTDIVIGSPIANRNRAETERLMGVLLNTLVLRTDLSGNPRFREVVQRVKEVTLAAYTHQDLPFEKLVEALRPERSLSHNPLFQTWFALHAPPISSRTLADLTLSPLNIDRETAQFDLSLEVRDAGDRLLCQVEYSTDRFTAATIARLQRHFTTLLTAIAAHPDQRLSELPLISAVEQQELTRWNQTETEYPQHSCLHHLIEAQVNQTPDAIAVVFGDQHLTYQELNARANQLAHYLHEMGVGPETLVGICVERSLDMVIGLLAILKAGGAYVPLDPAYPSERLSVIVEDAQISVLLTQTPEMQRLPNHSATVLCLDEAQSRLMTYSQANPVFSVTSDQLAYVVYTSGSTGRPKGVLISHRSLVNHGIEIVKQYHLTPSDRVLQFAALGFDVAAEEIFPCWLSGATLVLRPMSIRLRPPILSNSSASAG
ncbi:MAG: AMP-binding protein [Leptolyngbyaceae cyanobacterium SM1_4_3]|nr:AMP-binding protein [Leptolyngbyaceae cyanobacterium SM1_4_3]